MGFVWLTSILLAIIASSYADDKFYKTPQIYSMHIHSDITYRYSTTKVTSRVKNPGDQPREALFDVTLPNEAFITNLTVEIDGNITVGEIKEKEVAKKQYEAAKERGESAGYIGTKHRETNKFVLAITVAPQSKISFNLTYQELLKRKLGYYEHVIFIDPGQTVEDLDVSVSIVESRTLTHLNVPALSNDVGDSVSEVDGIVVISKPTEKTAIVRYAPTVEQQKLQSERGVAGRFVVQYDVERDLDIGDVMMVNGYFIHFFAPEGLQPIPNDVLFILDVSGSMQGKKLSQLKSAMLANLQQLSPADRFNLMTFSTRTKLWRDTMASVNDEDAMEDAKTFISSLEEGGWTNIDGAITRGLSFLVKQISEENQTRSPIIVFLTDGEPTQGEMQPSKILNNVRKLNEGNIPIFTLAFGLNADWDFVKKLGLQNNGFGRKIYEASDAALQIMGFYSEISVTLLSNITFNYLDVDTSNVTETRFSNYFNGSEVIICGQLRDNSTAMNIEVNFQSALGSNEIVLKGSNEIVLKGEIGEHIFEDLDNLTETKNFEEITEKVWAYLTIKQLLNKKLVADSSEEIDNIEEEVLKMSLKYGFVTPMTAMVVTKETELQGHSGEESEEVDILDDAFFKPLSSGRSFMQGPIQLPMMAYDLMDYSQIPVLTGMSMDPLPSRHIPIITPFDVDLKMVRAKTAKFVKSIPLKRKMKTKGNGKRRKGRKSKGKGKRKRKRNRHQKKGRVWKYPLVLTTSDVPQNLCFRLFDPVLDTKDMEYEFHSSMDKDVRINVIMSSLQLAKNIRRGSIKSVHIIATDDTLVIDSTSIREGLQTNSKHFTVSVDNGKIVTIEAKGAQYIVYDSMDELFINVNKDLVFNSTNGILGQIIQHDVKVKNTNKRGKTTLVLLSFDGSNHHEILRTLSAGIGPSESCLTEHKRRIGSSWYDMESDDVGGSIDWF